MVNVIFGVLLLGAILAVIFAPSDRWGERLRLRGERVERRRSTNHRRS